MPYLHAAVANKKWFWSKHCKRIIMFFKKFMTFHSQLLLSEGHLHQVHERLRGLRHKKKVQRVIKLRCCIIIFMFFFLAFLFMNVFCFFSIYSAQIHPLGETHASTCLSTASFSSQRNLYLYKRNKNEFINVIMFLSPSHMCMSALSYFMTILLLLLLNFILLRVALIHNPFGFKNFMTFTLSSLSSFLSTTSSYIRTFHIESVHQRVNF